VALEALVFFVGVVRRRRVVWLVEALAGVLAFVARRKQVGAQLGEHRRAYDLHAHRGYKRIVRGAVAVALGVGASGRRKRMQTATVTVGAAGSTEPMATQCEDQGQG
jgi:hypothetical protein